MERFYSVLFTMILLSSSSCSIFNSATVHVKYTDVRAEIDDVDYENIEKFGNISSSIRRVQHPKQYDKWDINFSLSPTIHFDRQLFHPVGVTEEDDVPDLTKSRLSILGNLKLTTHTPIGAFVLTGGYGQSFLKLSKDTGTESYRSTQIRRLDFVYLGFFARRFYTL